jgi:hypothetical protein
LDYLNFLELQLYELGETHEDRAKFYFNHLYHKLARTMQGNPNEKRVRG